jgi:hypothetical protein
MSSSDDQVRLNILELLHKNLSDDSSNRGVDRAIIQAILQIPQFQMDQNMSYLEEKGLVALFRAVGSQWTFAKLTADGIDVVENKERFAEKFSFTQTATSQIPTEAQKATKKAQSQVSFPELLKEAFNQAYKQVEAASLLRDEKVKVEKHLNELEKELKKTPKTDLQKILKLWQELMKNANWLKPTVGPVVLEDIKIRLGLA